MSLSTAQQGRIFDIQRYSIHDGSGIRTIVFFKGCFLRCKWCCNPESQNYEIEGNMGKDVSVEEIMKIVERDRVYYRRSGGGLTLSGGEVLFQPDFAQAILQTAKAKGINTSIESTAFANFNEIEKILPFLDEFLLDIKHTNSKIHKEFTKQPNEKILENAVKIAKSGLTNLIIRVPVIPGFNETVSEISNIATFAQSLPGVKEIHLLPYHSFGEGKYQTLGKSYPMSDTKSPTNIEMQELKKAVERVSNLHCQIGG